MHESEQRRRLSLPAARAAPPALPRLFPQPDPSPRSPSSSASLCCEARPTGAAVEFIQAAEMSLRAFDKSGSGRRTGNGSCENTNLAGGASRNNRDFILEVHKSLL